MSNTTIPTKKKLAWTKAPKQDRLRLHEQKTFASRHMKNTTFPTKRKLVLTKTDIPASYSLLGVPVPS